MVSKYKQEVELFEKQIYELEKMNIYLKLANDVLDRRVRDRYLNRPIRRGFSTSPVLSC